MLLDEPNSTSFNSASVYECQFISSGGELSPSGEGGGEGDLNYFYLVGNVITKINKNEREKLS